MNKKILKAIIAVILVVIFIIGIMYLIDLKRMKNGENVIFSTWGKTYAPSIKEKDVQQNTNNENQKYSKQIDSTTIEIDIPNEWNIKDVTEDEDDNMYKYALKFYKNDEEKYAMLYFYKNLFGVCGTARNEEKIMLHNGIEATIGYYDGSKNWSDILFNTANENIVIVNHGLVENEAEEFIELLTNINITNNENEYSFYGTITQIEKNLIFVEPDEGEEIRKSADKIMVQKLETDDNVKYEVGEKIKITYSGTVMETYPAQIKATNIESAKSN